MNRPLRLRIIFIQALLATLGSLYFGFFGNPVESFFLGDWFDRGNGFEPCTRCWYARILMYPIVLISGVGLIRRDNTVIRYIIPSVILGIILEIIHYSAQMLPSLDIGTTCTSAHPCAASYVKYFGFLTIPGLCLIAFIVIAIAIAYGRRREKKSSTFIPTIPDGK